MLRSELRRTLLKVRAVSSVGLDCGRIWESSGINALDFSARQMMITLALRTDVFIVNFAPTFAMALRIRPAELTFFQVLLTVSRPAVNSGRWIT